MPLAVEAKNLTKIYQRGAEKVVALSEVSFSIPSGELVAVTGPSGSGKSTLLSLIAGFDSPTTGSVSINGFDVTAAPAAKLDRLRTTLIGFIFQQFHLIQGFTAVENVELALFAGSVSPPQRRARALDALARMGISAQANRRPFEMSGGQQQRVAVARALVGNPTVILADEPTAALDSQSAKVLLDELAELTRREGVATLISTHDPRCLERAKTILALDAGVLLQ